MIVTAEVLNDVKLNVVRRKAKKSQIFLYDTGRRVDDYLKKLRYRNNEQYDDIPHYIITKSGNVIKLFNTNHSSKTFGNSNVDRRMVKIAMENLGWLNKNTITGVLHNWIGDPYRSEPYIKKWRDHYFWDPYSEEQFRSLVKLSGEICKDHGIPYQTVPGQGYLSNVRKFTGIVCKSNFLNIYTDINPSFNFNIFYKDEYKQTEEQL
jgi:N-acetyl-anhydromuramyl-L-alanine amidase AmpD